MPNPQAPKQPFSDNEAVGKTASLLFGFNGECKSRIFAETTYASSRGPVSKPEVRAFLPSWNHCHATHAAYPPWMSHTAT
jgi:hypothetical protein